MDRVTARPMLKDSRLPLLVTATKNSFDLSEFMRERASFIEETLIEHGAILFRDFNVRSLREFESFAMSASTNALDYIYRSTPRTTVGKNVFTASEYPADQEIPLHNENAYQRTWPLKLAFCCLVPATHGGETPLADMRRVTAGIPTAILDRFATRQVRYVRHYRPHVDLPWQTVFQTQSRETATQFCAENGIDCEWLDAETLRTAQTCQGTAYHPVTEEYVWFNQAHLFHISSLKPHIVKGLVNAFGADRLPRNSYYGDGEEIRSEDLEIVRNALRKESIAFSWQRGDVLFLDNMQVAHGRRPFQGRREVLTTLLEQHSPSHATR